MYAFIKNSVEVVLELLGVGQAARWAGTVTLGLFFLLLLVIVGTTYSCVSSCNDNNRQKKIDADANSEAEGKGAVEVIKDNVNAAQNEVTNAEEQSRQAEANFNAVVNTDSNTFDNKFSRAKDAWCRKRPNDSLCRAK